MASASSVNKVQQLYVAYYGRAGDPAGVEFWASTLDSNGGNVSEMINQFGNSDEYRDGIGAGTTSEQVTSLYQQMFNRAPESAGLDFWVSEINSGDRTLGEVAVAIAESALGDDATTLTNKVTAAEYFTEQISSSGATYEASNIDTVQGIISSVTSDTTTVTTANASSDDYAVTNTAEVTFTLTSALNEPAYVEYPDVPPVHLYPKQNEGNIEITGMSDTTQLNADDFM